MAKTDKTKEKAKRPFHKGGMPAFVATDETDAQGGGPCTSRSESAARSSCPSRRLVAAEAWRVELVVLVYVEVARVLLLD
jgi:hypothetical protein